MLRSPIKVLFVCLGNICRSPLAQGVFQHVAHQRGLTEFFVIDSAGTGGWHVGDSPDPRSINIARINQIDITTQRCRQIAEADFETYQYVFAMDNRNMRDLQSFSNSTSFSSIHLFLEFAGEGKLEIPDPYYGGDQGFQSVYQMLTVGSQKAIDRIIQEREIKG